MSRPYRAAPATCGPDAGTAGESPRRRGRRRDAGVDRADDDEREQRREHEARNEAGGVEVLTDVSVRTA
jgi:hypothetical protein